MAPDVLPVFPSEAEEQLRYRRRPLDVGHLASGASDASADAHPDAAADVARLVLPDVGAQKWVGRVPGVQAADAVQAKATRWLPDDWAKAVVVPGTQAAGPFAA